MLTANGKTKTKPQKHRTAESCETCVKTTARTARARHSHSTLIAGKRDDAIKFRTLRFLLPIVGALGAEAIFIMEGRLGERPLAPLDAVLGAHGMAMSAIVRTDDSDVAFASARSFLVSDAVIAGMTAMVIVGMNEQGSAKTVWQKL